MATRKKRMEGQTSEPNGNITLALILYNLLTILVHMIERTPADPEVMGALNRLDEIRQSIEKQLGAEVTQIRDPHGRLNK